MRYSVLNGGKRMRPLLTYCTGKTLGIAPEALMARRVLLNLFTSIL